MVFAVPLALLGATLVVLLAVPEGTPLLGLDHASFARAAFAVAFVVWLALAGARRAGAAGLARVLGGAAAWAAIILGLTGAYAYRFEAAEFAAAADGRVVPRRTADRRGRRGDRQPPPRRRIRRAGDDRQRRASRCCSTPAPRPWCCAPRTRRRSGIDTRGLKFDVDVVTANGAASAAEVVLDRVAVGPIVARNVAALVARKGALGESLLGMSFLERLQSYSVERGRLVLKGK